MTKLCFKKNLIGAFLLLTLQFICLSNANGQGVKGKTITVVGTVLDSANAIVENVSVSVQNNPKLGTSTDVNGRFVLDVPVGSTLIFARLNYNDHSYIVPEKPDSNLNIILSAKKVDAADEVVVAAYGRKQLKEATTGAVTTIKPGNLKIPSSNLTNALAGQIAGIIAYQPGGQPGYDNSQFFIRGVTTFGYSSNPLILIDNIESSTTDLARLQVDDIESFSILKDAGSTSLYGSRGANGVMLVTTKKGKEGKVNVYAKFENSFASPTKSIQLADPITYMNDYNEALVTRDPTQSPFYNANKIINTQRTIDNAPGSNPYAFPAVDWLNMLFKKNTNNQRANLSFTGGGGIATYYVSGSYNVDNGILKVDPVSNFNNNVKLKNYQFRSNININLTKTTELALKINGVFDGYNGPITTDPSGATDLYSQIMHTPSVLFPAYFLPDSANIYTNHILFGNYSLNGTNNVSYINPYANLLKGYSQFTRSNINVQVDLNQKLDFITKGLNFAGIFSTQRNSYYTTARQYNPFFYQLNTYNPVANNYTLTWLNNQTGVGAATEYLDYKGGDKTVYTQTYLQGILSYDRVFGMHTVSATVVGSRQEILNSALNVFLPDGVTRINTDLAASLPYRNISSSGRLSYTYDRRYSIEGSFGYNGSERFAANHRWGFFPTVGGAWNVSNEEFWNGKIKDILSKFKIRATYGKVGNDALSAQRFFYLSSINLNTGSPASFGTTNGYSHGGISTLAYPNSTITWETSRQTNLGFDLTFFRSLNITIDLYKQHRYNIYQPRVVPQALGLEASVAANLGTANTKGMDVQMDYSTFITSDLSITGRGNLTFTQSRYGKYEEPDYPGEPWRKKAGTLINQQFGYVAERLFIDDQEANNSPVQSFAASTSFPQGGDIKYRDINADGKIDISDQVAIGYATVPQITYGFGVTVRYKAFDLNTFFQGNAKVSFFINPSDVSPFVGNNQLLKAFADNHWSESNQNQYAEYPRTGVSSNVINNNLQQSSWWLRNGAFLRLKTVELGYSFPTKWLQKYHLTNCRFYVSGLNLLTFSSFKDWDVEQGGKAFAYPIQKVINAGIYININ